MRKVKIKEEFSKYGINLSSKEFFLETLSLISGIIFIAFLLKINKLFLTIVIFLSLMIVPLIIIAHNKQKASLKKFEMLSDYLSNILPTFLQKSKIRFALAEVKEITSGSMKQVINEAINYIDKTRNDPDLFVNAFKIIEKEFPNSRIKSVHKFLLTVETTNSNSFKEVADNLYEDIEGWISRTYTFQKDLLNRRNKLLILCFMTLLMDVMFIYVYSTNDFFNGFTDNILYQISTTLFVITIEIVSAIVLAKLNGEWLIDDNKVKNEELLNKRYAEYKKGIKRITIIDILLALIFIALAIYFYILNNIEISISLIFVTIIYLTKNKRKYRLNKKYVSKAFAIEFPVWLREVSLSLSNLTVLNSIENSINIVSFPLRKEIRKFLNKANKNPTSIKPYNDFLIEFNLEDIRSSMRVLYSINNLSKNDMKIRISRLIDRNQELLSKAESIRNEDSIGGIEALGYVPTIIFSIQIMFSMFIMFFYMINNLGNTPL